MATPDKLNLGLRIAEPGKQGVPSVALPYRVRPQQIGKVASGAAFSDDGKTMSRDMDLTHGMETYSRTFRAKWSEGNPMNALGFVDYAGTQVPTLQIPGLHFSAADMGKDPIEGVRMLSRLMHWFEFVTLPWTGYARPPLLMLVIGPHAEYVYLESHDLKVEAVMPDTPTTRDVAFLPYEVSGSLSFKRETLGLEVFTKRTIPVGRNLAGGSGGIVGTERL